MAVPQDYNGPFVVDPDEEILHYFLKDGIWFYRNICVGINVECRRTPPAIVVDEWESKFGSIQPSPPVKHVKQRMATTLPTPVRRKLHNTDKGDEIVNKKRKHEAMRDSPTTSTPKMLSHNQLSKTLRKTPNEPPPKAVLPSSKFSMPTSNARPSSFETPAQTEILSDHRELKESEPILITPSEPLIREARERFKLTADPSLYEQLLSRMEIRKMIMEPCDEDEIDGISQKDRRLKPFVPSTNMLEQQREYEHEKQCTDSHEIITQLLIADETETKFRNRAVLQKDTFRPIPYRLEGKQSVTLNVEDLATFIETTDVTLLNVDRFITATDQRVPVVNSEGNCVFCSVHCVPNAGVHSSPNECPYTFCTCVQCYVAEKCAPLRG